MQFEATPLDGVVKITSDVIGDDRGSFYRSFCREEFAANSLPGDFVQCNISRNRMRGTVRGMHFQAPPHEEGKLVRCIRGAVYDVVVDLRAFSPTFRKSFGAELTEVNAVALYIPPGFAHGFQTLQDDSDLLYQMTTFYHPGLARGVRWDDPSLGISWPLPITVISDRDTQFADFPTG